MNCLAKLTGGLLLLAVVAVRGETLTIATYNIENYGVANRMTDAGYRKDYPKPEIQKDALRDVIRALGVDVLVLQEVGGESYLEELRGDLRSGGVDYPHAVIVNAEDPDRKVAVLSRRPLLAATPHDALEFSYLGRKEKVKRGLLEVRLATAAGEVTLFGVHLKSRYTDRPDDPRSEIRRVSEATTIRDAILERFPAPAAARFLIIGDFNDDHSSKAVRRMLQRGETRIATLLPVADSRGETWTHAYRKTDSYTRVDHVLVSPGLRGAVKEGRARIFDGAGVREAGDHRPVIVTLELSAEMK